MTVEEIGDDIAGNGRFAGDQQVQISGAFFGRDLVADVEQLAEVRIELLALGIMAQGGDILRRGPFRDRAGDGQFRAVNVNDRGVRRAKFVHVFQRLGVNLFCQHQPLPAGFGQADDFLQPARARGFKVQAGLMPRQCPADGRVDGKLVAAGMDAEFEIVRQAVTLHRKGDAHTDRR